MIGNTVRVLNHKRAHRNTAWRAREHVHSIGIYITCSDPHETATSCTAYTTKQQQTHVSNTHHPRTTTPTQPLHTTTQKLQLPPWPPREDGHVPNRCRGKTIARHTELSSRPCARCTVVQVHSIGNSITITCSDDPHETATSCTAYTTKQQQSHVSNTHHPRTTTPTQTLRHTTQKLQLPLAPPAKMATFPTDVAARR